MNFLIGNSELYCALVAICLLGLSTCLWGLCHYRQIVNPLTVFVAFDIGVLTILSSLVSVSLDQEVVSGVISVLWLAHAYFAGFLVVFLLPGFSLPRRLFGSLLRLAGMKRARYSRISHLLLVVFAVIAFVLLALTGGGGALWLTDPRSAYISYRSGAGQFFLLAQWTLMAAFLYHLMIRKPGFSGLAIGVLLYSLAAYFTGSKHTILMGLIVTVVYFNFFIRKISFPVAISGVVVIFGAFLMLVSLHGAYESPLLALAYFKDYANTTAAFLMRFDEFGLHWGYGMISSLWFYVPRALVSAKPYEYGITLIHAILIPGAAETGHTPGLLPWALYYLDFGALGVFASGVCSGIIRRGAYEAFLSNKSNLLAFMFMCQLSIWPIFPYATFPLTIFIGISIALFMRYRIVFPLVRC